MATGGRQIQHSDDNTCCRLIFPVPEKHVDPESSDDEVGVSRTIENVRNCDIFLEDYNFLLFADVHLFKYHSKRQFDTKSVKNLIIKYDTTKRCFEVQLPCFPENELAIAALQTHKSETNKKLRNGVAVERSLDLWKLKRITADCQLQLDEATEYMKFEANFNYGFACKYKGRIECGESDLSAISRMPEPHLTSPVQRSIDREIEELKNFSREQYKLNFVELQVPEGHDNPMKFTIYYDDLDLNRTEESLLHNITQKPEENRMPESYDQAEVDCGLISILLAICYDIRSTSNEPTCESAWTRSILSASLTYFEPFSSLKEVVISFLRRSLIYPIYRNYDFGRLCVEDAIEALQKNPNWLLKQLLITHELFATSDCNREIFNRYYLNDYIRYAYNIPFRTVGYFQTLAYNLKNVLLDVYKTHLRLDLGKIETELLKELITDMHIIPSSASEGDEDDEEDDDDDDDDDEDDEDDEDEDADDDSDADEDDDDDNEDVNTADNGADVGAEDSSSASETEENSVIEQHLDALKL